MASVFTKLIAGEIPGRFVWSDEKCVAFLSINPLKHGHTLVVPREEVDHWIDLDSGLAAHLMTVSQSIGKALQQAFSPGRIGLMIAGLEVPHVHIHVVPMDGVHDLDFANAARNPDPGRMDSAADEIRATLTKLGYEQAADKP